jgi:ribose transport system ATP-binding protein
VRSGEIVGLAGLVGAGRSELAQLIFGVRKATGGMIEVDGEPVVIHSRARPSKTASVFSPRTARSRGVSGAGGAGEHHYGDAGARRHLRLAEPQKAQSISDDAIALLNIRVPHSQVRAGGLSGGNQQNCSSPAGSPSARAF